MFKKKGSNIHFLCVLIFPYISEKKKKTHFFFQKNREKFELKENRKRGVLFIEHFSEQKERIEDKNSLNRKSQIISVKINVTDNKTFKSMRVVSNDFFRFFQN